MGRAKKFWLAAAILGLLFVATQSAGESDFKLVILHNNDLHGQFSEVNAKGSTCSSAAAKLNKCFGGFARISQLIKTIRDTEHDKTVLYLNAGDTFTGSALYSLFRENITSEFLNQLNPDAMCLGNHEFDEGVKILRNFLATLKFPVVTANMDLSKVPELQQAKNLYNSIVLDRNGRRIGIIGYVTPETKFKNVQNDVEYYEEVERINIETAILKAQGVNIIIGLGHSGFPVDMHIAMNCPDIDLVIGGHTNTFLYNGKKPDIDVPVGPYPYIVTQPSGKHVPVVQAYAYSKYVGMLNLTFNATGDITQWSGQPILLDHTHAQDPEFLHLLLKYRQKALEMDKLIIGRTSTLLDGNSCRLQECNFGNLIVDAMVWYYTRSQFDANEYWTDTSIAFINSGAIRASIDVRDRTGIVSVFNVHSSLAFKDNLVIATVNGSEIRNILENSVAKYSKLEPNGGFLQMAGVRVAYNLSQPIGHRLDSVSVMCTACSIPKYIALVDDQLYKIIISQFLMNGGDKFPMPRIRTVTEFAQTEAVMEYIRTHNFISPRIENRITLYGEIEE